MNNKQLDWGTWIWIVVALAVILSTGLGAGWLLQRYDQQRGFDAEASKIAEILKLAAGMTVADVLAGSGKWSVDLSRRVGPSGHVISTESGPGQVARLREAMARPDLTNVEVVESIDSDSGLDAECCDAILVRAAYHDLNSRADFNRTLRRGLKPGGLMAIIEYDQSTQEYQSGHGIGRTRLIEELTAAGFAVDRVMETWSGHAYCVLFRPAEAATTH